MGKPRDRASTTLLGMFLVKFSIFKYGASAAWLRSAKALEKQVDDSLADFRNKQQDLFDTRIGGKWKEQQPNG